MFGVDTGAQILVDGSWEMLGEGLLQGWVAAPEAFPGFQTSLLLSQIIPGVPNQPRHSLIAPAFPASQALHGAIFPTHLPLDLGRGGKGEVERGGGDGRIRSALGNLWERI